MKSVHSGRLERWLGTEKVEEVSRLMKNWYGPPIHLLDVPGSVRVCRDGDFVGPFERGYFWSFADALTDRLKAIWTTPIPQSTLYAGFASISDALSRASAGYTQTIPFYKAGATGVANISTSCWRLAGVPSAGAAPGNPPAGTAYTSASAGAIKFTNPASGTLHLVGADAGAGIANNSLLLYDLIFGVNKTMNSNVQEAVTGVPTRYQSLVETNPDYVGGNFLFIQVGGTPLAATGHNWTVCTYKDQADAASTLPSVTGVASAIVDRFDDAAVNSWFEPLEAGDVGIKALTALQCSAAVATGVVWFMIGHPIGFMAFPIASSVFPFDWLTNRNQAPRIFDDACLALLNPSKPSTSSCTFTGALHLTSAAA